jgi:hypothetical protein
MPDNVGRSAPAAGEEEDRDHCDGNQDDKRDWSVEEVLQRHNEYGNRHYRTHDNVRDERL